MLAESDLNSFYEVHRVLIREEGFAYLLPHPALRNWVSNYTISYPTACTMSDNYAIIPHGCATLVFSCNGNTVYGNLFGPATQTVCVGCDANRYDALLIIEFQPAGFYAFSGMPQKELTDSIVPFASVNPALNNSIVRQIEDTADLNTLISAMDRLLLANLKAAVFKEEFSAASKAIVSSGGLISVKELSQNLFYSERHLSRVFGEHLGVSIKAFSRLVRVNRAARLLQKPQYSITQTYLQTGYYDMPHFIHDFKSICGVTPQEYRQNLSDFYSEIAKF